MVPVRVHTVLISTQVGIRTAERFLIWLLLHKS